MLDSVCISPVSIIKFTFYVLPCMATIYLFLKGVIPVLYRLGMGLSKKKIAIFAQDSEFNELKRLLLQSEIFKEKNIIQITKNNIEAASGLNVFLVYWKDSKEIFDQIKVRKSKDTPLIIYAPPQDPSVDEENMCVINNTMNAILVRFKGRLLNDILVSLMTTSYTK